MPARRSVPLLLLAPAAARAHSELRGSDPADGARLPAAPGRIRLSFNEQVQLTALRLRGAAGQEVALPRARDALPRSLHEAAAPPLPPGAYVLEWRAISADGHPIRGRIRFEVAP